MQLNPFTKIIGLDISDSKIRFVQLKQKMKENIIDSMGEIHVPDKLITAGEINDEEAVVKLIEQMFSKPIFGKLDTKFINSVLPEKKIFIKTIKIPNVPENEINGAVRWGIEQNIPVSLENVYFDWQILSDKNTVQSDKLEILVSVAPKKVVDQYSKVIKKTNSILIGLENESIATARSLISFNKKNANPLLIIDIGRSRTNLMIFHNNAIQFASTLNVSGHEMTNAITKSLKLKFEDAEKAKIICGLDRKKSRGEIRRVIEPIMFRLITKINENINFYNSYIAKDKKINTLILTGSVSQMYGITKFLREQLKRTVIIGDPLSQITSQKSKKMLNKNKYPSFTTAIGLTLKKFDYIE